MEARLVKSLVIELSFQSLCLPGGQGVGLKVPTL